MVRSQLGKSTFREIRSSLGRFMAILAIIGLGVGFFAGLKIAKQAMVTTVDDYLEEHEFYDYRLLSTLGFEQESVEYLSSLDGVSAVEGSLSFDVIYQLEPAAEAAYEGYIAKQGVVKTHSLTEELNTVKLTAGRMPEHEYECVADSNLFGEGDLGSVLVLAKENKEDTLEHFSFDRYTIVGIVQSPLYLQYERGNTSLGDGRLDGFVYLPRKGFSEEYFTEIYIALQGNYELYSDEYRDLIDGSESAWEAYGDTAADLRYQSVLADAWEEINDARKELEDKRAEGEEELADAAATLADAEKELADGAQALEDARKELEDGKKTLRKKQTELNDAKQTVAEKEAELADGERELQEGIDSWNSGKDSLQSARNQLDDQKSELAAQKASLEEGLAGLKQLDDGIAATEAGIVQVDAWLAQAESGLLELEGMIDQICAEIETVDNQIAALVGEGGQPGENPPDEGRSEGGTPEGVPSEDDYSDLEELIAKRKMLQARKEYLDEQVLVANAQKVELVAARADLIQQKKSLQAQLVQLEPMRSELEAGAQLIAQYEAQIALAEDQIASGERELADAWETIESSRREIEDGRKALEDARAEIADGQKALADARRELADAEDTLAEKEAEFADAQVEYEDGLKEYQDAQKEFDEKIADAEAELADAEAELADLEAPSTYLLGRDTNVGYVCFENDSGIVEGIANIFPVFFILVAALVCVTTMNRMVEEQRTQIGVLKALGYSEAAVMSKYMVYSGTASVIGCAAGFLLGTWGFPKVIWAAYGIMYNAEDILYVFNWKLAAFSVAVSLLCSIGTTWLSCRVELSQVAAQLMRPKSPKAGKRVFLERIPILWNRLSFLRKVSLRNIFRYKKRLFMMILGISGCTALLVTGFGIKDSIAGVADRQFKEIQTYDLGLSLRDPVDASMLAELEKFNDTGVNFFLCVMEKNLDLVTKAGIKSVIVVVGDPEKVPEFVNLHTQEGLNISYPEKDEGVISDKLAEEYDVEVGDVVTLRDENMQEITITVTAVQKNYIYNYVYISEETWKNQMREMPEQKTVYVNVDPAIDVHEMAAALMQLDNVSNVTVNLDTMERIGSMMASLDIIVVTVILCAAGLAFIVLYNLTNINITERIREIATIKVLGFYKKETASYVFRENLLLSAMGMALGLVLGKFLHSFVMNEIQVDMISFDVYVRSVSYVYSGVLTIGFAWLVGKVMGGKLERISMTESLKSVD